MVFTTLKEAANKWGLSERIILILYMQGKIAGEFWKFLTMRKNCLICSTINNCLFFIEVWSETYAIR